MSYDNYILIKENEQRGNT